MSSSRFVLNMLEEEELDDEVTWAVTIASVEHINRSMNNDSHRVGSILNHRIISRNRLDGHNRLYQDYFAENLVYPEHLFRRRFRMRRTLFFQIQEAVEMYDSYFVQRRNAVGVIGLSSLQKITVALRMIVYGIPGDAVDEYLRLGSSTTIESLKRFVKAIVEIFGSEYLRRPNSNDIRRLKAMAEQRGCPGMLGSIDCMHWKWKNCPTAWRGMYTGHVHEPTIILEAIASYDLWIWHAFFGLPGSLNDINVLDRSNLFSDLAEGRGPNVMYTINGHHYNLGYYLVDGIYPSWPTFVKTIPSPQGNKRKLFAVAQESARKDVERVFGVLQARFAIIRGPSLFWDVETMKYIMIACIVLHNMIVEDERDNNYFDFNYDVVEDTPTIEVSQTCTAELMDFIHFHHQIRDRQAHIQLQNDLVEHLWQKHGENVD